MTGEAEILDPPPNNWPELNVKMTVKYVGEDEAKKYLGSLPDVPGAWIRIRPRKLVSWKGSEWHPRYLG
jgi:hypothetical protein